MDTNHKSSDFDWTILFSQGHLWRHREDLCFVIIYAMSKNNVHHHIKIMHTWCHLQSVKAWHLVQIFVYQRNLTITQFKSKTMRRAKVVSLLRQYTQDNSISTPRIRCLHSFATLQEEKIVERLETINNQLWSLIVTQGMTHQEQEGFLVATPITFFYHLAAKGPEK